jgi:hypothetical protein
MGGEKPWPFATVIRGGKTGRQKGKLGRFWFFVGGGVDLWDHSGTDQNLFG